MNYKFTYNEYKKIINKFKKIFIKEKFGAIIAISAGGLPLGVHLKNLFKKPLYITDPKKMYESLNISIPNKKLKYLLVDDINDTGDTLELILNRLNKSDITNIKTFTLLERPTSIFRCDYYGKKYTDKKWVDFFWEI